MSRLAERDRVGVGLPGFEEFRRRHEAWLTDKLSADPMGEGKVVAAGLVRARLSKKMQYKILKMLFSMDSEQLYEECKRDPEVLSVCLEELGLK
ncbi:MAG: hypothetical protein OdinLCB4_006730 [Candidatus Odinarchaeum yellowstonii]|uniref:Uncharacterized protein n=1 Tax=Odinarchaeota yellowstonii (strain LCB_4) TaxID=1841599 RepID=A0AAF0D1Y2_ODILC|nr:MAG: hypothetical protein OdinLCB4_006730 [Candidatus Odinarchaeum yellowstonii]